VRAGDLGRSFVTVDPCGDPIPLPAEADAFGVETDFHALVFEDLADRVADVFILAADEPRSPLNQCHVAPEAAIDLGKLEADVAAADHDQVLRQFVELEQSGAGQVIDLVEPRQVRHARPGPDVQKDLLGAQKLLTHLNGVRTFEPRMAAVQRDVHHPFEPAGDPSVRLSGDLSHSRLDLFHVCADPALDGDAVLRGPAGKMSRSRAGHQCLRGNTAEVDTTSADLVPFDHGDLATLPVESRGERWSSLAGADDDGVVLLDHLPLLA
jgi:hypothetical protein